jgi:NAD(P)-dependent dehydrogenase (short-subunit alcohol dehydrogenase family)
VVTGAAHGLGRAIAERLAAEGAQVAMLDVDRETLAEAAGRVPRAVAVPCDLTSPEATRTAAEHVLDAVGTPRVLVNNAAVYPYRPFDAIEMDEWDRVFAVNARATLLLAQSMAPAMERAGGGAIVNIASVTFFLGFPGLADYAASKGAVIGLTRTLARELGPRGITVNAVSPGAIPTRAEEILPDREAYSRYVIEQQCVKRRGTPEDVAASVAFLAGPDATFITGQTLEVCGGWYFN